MRALSKDFKHTFEDWLASQEITVAGFREWYGGIYKGIPTGVIRRQIGRMNKVAEDERVGPRSRMLATFVSSYWSARLFDDSQEHIFLASIILGEFVNKAGFKLYGKDTNNPNIEESKNTKLELNAVETIKKAFASMSENLQKEGFTPTSDDREPESDTESDAEDDSAF